MSGPTRDSGGADGHVRLVARALQVFLGVAVLRGVSTGSPELAINALVSLLVTFAPDILYRRWDVTVPPVLVAWMAVAAAMHVAGMVFGLYAPPARYDDLTHAVSGSFVGATGLVGVRLWERRLPDLTIPAPFELLVVLAVVMAGGVAWELIEFAVGGGGRAVQTSLADTMSDLLFNLGGSLVAVALGWSALDRIVTDLTADLAGRETDERANERTVDPPH